MSKNNTNCTNFIPVASPGQLFNHYCPKKGVVVVSWPAGHRWHGEKPRLVCAEHGREIKEDFPEVILLAVVDLEKVECK